MKEIRHAIKRQKRLLNDILSPGDLHALLISNLDLYLGVTREVKFTDPLNTDQVE